MNEVKQFQKVEGYRYGVGHKPGSGTLQLVTDGEKFVIGFDAFNLIDGESCQYATFEFNTLQECLDHAKKEGYL